MDDKTMLAVKYYGSQFEFLEKNMRINATVAVVGQIREESRPTERGLKKEKLIYAKRIILLK